MHPPTTYARKNVRWAGSRREGRSKVHHVAADVGQERRAESREEAVGVGHGRAAQRAEAVLVVDHGRAATATSHQNVTRFTPHRR